MPPGMMEKWNVGILGIENRKPVHEYVLRVLFFLNPSFHDSNIPLFQL
jgi:hypothetical protein